MRKDLLQPGPKMKFVCKGVYRGFNIESSIWVDKEPVTYGDYLEAVKAGAVSPLVRVWALDAPIVTVNISDAQARSYAKWAGKRVLREIEMLGLFGWFPLEFRCARDALSEFEKGKGKMTKFLKLPGPRMTFIQGGTFNGFIIDSSIWVDSEPVTYGDYLEAVKAGAVSPLERVGDLDAPIDPMDLDHAQAKAYAKWAGKRLLMGNEMLTFFGGFLSEFRCARDKLNEFEKGEMNKFLKLPGPRMIYIERDDDSEGGFWIDENPVTYGDYLEAVKAGAVSPLPDLDRKEGAQSISMVEIGYHQAWAYAKWAGKRLPTVEEWVWAAQGGSLWSFDFRCAIGLEVVVLAKGDWVYEWA